MTESKPICFLLRFRRNGTKTLPPIIVVDPSSKDACEKRALVALGGHAVCLPYELIFFASFGALRLQISKVQVSYAKCAVLIVAQQYQAFSALYPAQHRCSWISTIQASAVSNTGVHLSCHPEKRSTVHGNGATVHVHSSSELRPHFSMG